MMKSDSKFKLGLTNIQKLKELPVAVLPARLVSCPVAIMTQLVIVTTSCDRPNARNETSAAGITSTGQRILGFARSPTTISVDQ